MDIELFISVTSRCQDESADIVKVEIGVVFLDIFDPVYIGQQYVFQEIRINPGG
jgi:hypothetical protein